MPSIKKSKHEIQVPASLFVGETEIYDSPQDSYLFEIAFDLYYDDEPTVSIRHILLNTGMKTHKVPVKSDLTECPHMKDFAENLVWKWMEKTDYEILNQMLQPEEYLCGHDLTLD